MSPDPIIDHDPNENEKLPGHLERQWARRKFGTNVGGSDLLNYIAPTVILVVVFYLMRHGWPF